MIPAYNVPMTYMSGGIDIAKAYALIGQKAQAKKVLGDIFNNAWQYMRWYNSLNTNRFAMSQQECMMQIYIMRLCLDIAPLVDEKWADALETKWEMSVKTYQERGGQLPM